MEAPWLTLNDEAADGKPEVLQDHIKDCHAYYFHSYSSTNTPHHNNLDTILIEINSFRLVPAPIINHGTPSQPTQRFP